MRGVRDRVVEQRAARSVAAHPDAAPRIDDRERVEAGEHQRRAPMPASFDAPRATTRSAAWPSSNAHQPTQNPGVRRSRAAKPSAPAATTTSAGATPTTVERPRRTAATAAPGGRLLTSPDATRSACRTGPRYRRAAGRSGPFPVATRSPTCPGPRRYHDRTVRSPLAALRALSGRIVIAIVLCALVMGAAVFRINSYIDDRIDEIPRVQLTTAPASAPSTNFLIIGSDTRSFVQSEADKEAFTDADTTADGPARSDTMMVLHADGDASYVVSFPRDLMVNVPGLGRQKINAAFNKGPQLVIDTLQQDFNVPINHYLEVNFKSFEDIVNAVGSVPVWIPQQMRDQFSGLKPFLYGPGCYHLDGATVARLRALPPPRVLRERQVGRRQRSRRHRPHRAPAGLHQAARPHRGAEGDRRPDRSHPTSPTT